MGEEGRWAGGEEAAQDGGGSISAPSWEQSCVTQPWSSTNKDNHIEPCPTDSPCPHLPDRLNPDWCRLRTGTAGTLLAQPAILEAAMVGTALVLRTTSWTGPSYSPRGTPCTSASCGRDVRCEPRHYRPSPPSPPRPFSLHMQLMQPTAQGSRLQVGSGQHRGSIPQAHTSTGAAPCCVLPTSVFLGIRSQSQSGAMAPVPVCTTVLLKAALSLQQSRLMTGSHLRTRGSAHTWFANEKSRVSS